MRRVSEVRDQLGARRQGWPSPRDRAAALAQLQSLAELGLLLRMSAFAVLVPGLMRLSLPRLAGLLELRPVSVEPRPGQLESYERVADLAPCVAGPLVRTGCLTRGLTLFWFLRRSGYGVELVFGLDPTDGPTDGHCWLEYDGEVVCERRDPRPRFIETFRLGARSAQLRTAAPGSFA